MINSNQQKSKPSWFGDDSMLITAVMPMMICTALICLLWVNFAFALILAVFFFWLSIPSIIASIVFMVRARKMTNFSERLVFAWGSMNIILFVLYCFLRLPMQSCSVEDMAAHYEQYGKEMDETIAYIDQALDDSAFIHLEFDGYRVEMFYVSGKRDSLIHNHWDDAGVMKDSLMSVVGLTKEEFDNIRTRLKRIGCIGVATGNAHSRAELFFRREGMGMYSYDIYKRPLTKEEKEMFMHDGMFIPYSEKVIFVYGGGVFGPQSFPEEAKRSFLKQHKPW